MLSSCEYRIFDIGEIPARDVFDRAIAYRNRVPEAIISGAEDSDVLEQANDERYGLPMSYITGSGPGRATGKSELVDPRGQDLALQQCSETERASHCIQAERLASDQIRLRVIPELLREARSSAESYWEIHRNRFAETPASIQNFGSTPFVLADYTIFSSKGDYYASNIGRLRSHAIACEGTFIHLAYQYLPRLSDEFFCALDNIFAFGERDLARNLTQIVLAQAFLTLAHLPFDGAGRTNEDFIVYCAKRLGIDLSLSASGYRHHLSPLVEAFSSLETRFKYEYDTSLLYALGIVPPGFDGDFWLSEVEDVVSKVNRYGGRALLVEKSKLSSIFIDALRGDQEAENKIFAFFPSLAMMKEVFESACSETYSFLEAEAGRTLDLWMAKSLVTPPWQFRAQLHKERDDFPKDKISQAFLTEYLHTRTGNFVSDRHSRHFRDVRKALGPSRTRDC